jgi:hypothetical protein
MGKEERKSNHFHKPNVIVSISPHDMIPIAAGYKPLIDTLEP